MGKQAASEPQGSLEVGAVHLDSAVKFTAQDHLTTATEPVDITVSQACGAPPASEVSAMAMASSQDTEEDTANCTVQNTAHMAISTPLATAHLVLAMYPVGLVSEQAVVVRCRWLPARDVAAPAEHPEPPVPVPALVPVPAGSDWLTSP